MMSSSDSDYSIDWLASDDDDYDSPQRSSPECVEEPPAPPPSSSSSSSLRESLTSRFHSGATQKRRRNDCCDCKDGGHCGVNADSPAGLQTSLVGPGQGFTPVYTQQTLSVESRQHSTRKRAHGAGLDGLCEKPEADTEDEVFTRTRSKLQCYIQPLSSILRGLRSGRYSERLSSFQESVAMDRIQRIMGVLQSPNKGGGSLNMFLVLEKMLQSWFPQAKPDRTHTHGSAPAKKQKHHRSASPPPSFPPAFSSSDAEPALVASCSSTHLKWLHTSPICSLNTPESTLSHPADSASPLPARWIQRVTQDNAVSSTTDTHARPLRPRGPLPFKISSPCLERLLQAKESIIAPRTVGDGGCPF